MASTSLDGGEDIALVAHRWRDSVAIVIEQQLTLDFYDPAVLGRLATLATEGERVLRAKLATLGDEPDDRGDGGDSSRESHECAG